MRLFIKKIGCFVIIIIILMFLFTYLQREWIWEITNSISMDSKLAYGRQMDVENLDIIALGSSMTLNNLNSEKVMEGLPEDLNFFNYGAYGMQIQDTKILFENLLQTSKPQCIIIVSNVPDFYGEQESRYAGKDLKNYMDGRLWNDVLLVARYGFPHNINSIKNYKLYQSLINDYSSLDYDSYGGVALQVYGENISSDRWDIVLTQNAKELQYLALDELCKLAAGEDVRLYFVQSPCRAHYLSGEESEAIMRTHMERCKEIVEGNGQTYYSVIDSEKYEDMYFADYIHLNREGSQLFTEEFMEFFQKCEMDEK